MIEKLCVGVRSFVRSGSDLLFLFVIFVRQRGHGSGGSTSVGNSNSGRCEAPGIWGDRLGGGGRGTVVGRRNSACFVFVFLG